MKISNPQKLASECLKHIPWQNASFLLYYMYVCDMAAYYKFLYPISGLKYTKIDKELDCTTTKIKVVFGKKQKELVRRICKKWALKPFALQDFIENSFPWKACRDTDVIPYSLINNEDPHNIY